MGTSSQIERKILEVRTNYIRVCFVCEFSGGGEWGSESPNLKKGNPVLFTTILLAITISIFTPHEFLEG